MLTVLIALGSFVAGVLVGVVFIRGKRRIDAALWRVRAVEMAKMNHALMDRVEILEEERKKES